MAYKATKENKYGSELSIPRDEFSLKFDVKMLVTHAQTDPSFWSRLKQKLPETLFEFGITEAHDLEAIAKELNAFGVPTSDLG